MLAERRRRRRRGRAPRRPRSRSGRRRRCQQRTKVLFAFRELVNAQRRASSPRLITDEHGKVLSDARGEVQRGLEVVEFACGIPHLLKGDYSDQVSTGVDAYSFREPLGVVRRHHAVQLPGDGADVDVPGGDRLRQHLRAQAQRARPVGVACCIAELWAEAGLPDGVFNVVHGDKEAVDALLDHPDVAAVSFVGSTPIAQVHPRARHRATASGCRRSAAPRTTRSCCPTPTSTSPPTTSPRPPSARPASGAWRSRPPSPSAAPATRWSRRSARRRARSRSAPAATPASEMGPVVTREAPRAHRRAHRHRRGAGRRRSSSTAAGCVVPGHEDGFFVGPTVHRPGHAPTMDVYTRGDLRPGAVGRPRRRPSTRRSTLINANPYGNGTAIFTSSGEAARRFQRGVRSA